jgi:hypothetical protein
VTAIEMTRVRLTSLPAIVARVGSRIYPMRLPELKGTGQLPALELSLIGRPSQGAHLRGPGTLFTAHVQVDAWDASRDGAASLADLCARRLDGFQGSVSTTGSPLETQYVQKIDVSDNLEFFEEDILGGLARVALDVYVTYLSTAAMLAFT